MAEHRFQLTISGALTDARLDALVGAGCDDATFSTKGELTFGDFSRAAPDWLQAVVSAISSVESVQGLEVLSVDPDELVWASEIAQRTGRTRQSVDMLIKGRRGPGGFPAPATHATRNPLWRWSEVGDWFARYEGKSADPNRSALATAINGALQARHSLRNSPQAVSLRRVLGELLAS